MVTQISAAVQFLVILIIVAAVVGVPLASVYRSTCGEGRGEREYSVVVPFVGEKPEGCRDHRSGLTLLREEVGLD